jgi:hypothetical protein
LASITLVLARIALVSHSYWLALTHSYWLASALALASIGSHWLVSARLGRIGLHGFVSVVSAISRIVHTHFGRIGRIGSYPTHSHWLAFARTALVLARANSYWFALACVALVLAMIALVLRQRPFYLVQVFLRLTEPVFIERSFFFLCVAPSSRATDAASVTVHPSVVRLVCFYFASAPVPVTSENASEVSGVLES